MVREKVGIQANHVKSHKHLANMKADSSQHQDGKKRETDRMKKMTKSRSFKLPDLEALRSLPLRRSLSPPRKSPPLHVLTIAASPQEHKPFVRRSPNYMKPTKSSDAKKKLLPVSLGNTQSSVGGKNLPQKCLRNSKDSSVSRKNPKKTLLRSSSLNLVRTLTKTPSFKPCRATFSQDVNAPERATCSSTLKDSKFPAYLVLNPGGSEGASVRKVCPYKYCSLSHHHAPLPQLNSFMSARRHLLKTQKHVKLEAPQRLKVPRDTKKDSDIEQVVFNGKPACDEDVRGNPIIPPLAQEIGMGFYIEIYAKEEEGVDETRRFKSVKHLEDQEDSKFATEENGNSAEEDGVKQLTFKNNFDAMAMDADAKGSCHQEQNAEDEDDNYPPSWFHEEICLGSYCSEVSHDGEHLENMELDDSDSRDTDMELEEEQICSVDHEEHIDSPVIMQKETDSEFESLSESSHDISEMWLDDILSNHHVDILVEEALQVVKEEKSTYFEAQPHEANSDLEGTSESIKFKTQETDYLSSGGSYEYDQSSLIEEVFQHLTNLEDTNRENEKHVDDDEASCASMVLDEDTTTNIEGKKSSEPCRIDESHGYNNTSLQNNDQGINQENQIQSSDVPKERIIVVPHQEQMEEDQVRAGEYRTTSCIGGEEQNTSKNWQWIAKRKRPVPDVEEMRKINPRKPNFLPLVHDPEPEKVDLKHQMMDERKSADEWMLDSALRQAVIKLAAAEKRVVALLVEAFGTIMSIAKCETGMKNDSPIAHARPMQARS